MISRVLGVPRSTVWILRLFDCTTCTNSERELPNRVQKRGTLDSNARTDNRLRRKELTIDRANVLGSSAPRTNISESILFTRKYGQQEGMQRKENKFVDRRKSQQEEEE